MPSWWGVAFLRVDVVLRSDSSDVVAQVLNATGEYGADSPPAGALMGAGIFGGLSVGFLLDERAPPKKGV